MVGPDRGFETNVGFDLFINLSSVLVRKRPIFLQYKPRACSTKQMYGFALKNANFTGDLN